MIHIIMASEAYVMIAYGDKYVLEAINLVKSIKKFDNYDKCIETILHHEGGYVNHPDDPGGETNLGVTKKVYLNHSMTRASQVFLVD